MESLTIKELLDDLNKSEKDIINKIENRKKELEIIDILYDRFETLFENWDKYKDDFLDLLKEIFKIQKEYPKEYFNTFFKEESEENQLSFLESSLDEVQKAKKYLNRNFKLGD